MIRRFGLALAFIASIWFPASGMAQPDIAELYEARTIVTGMREETRLKGFGDCLRLVLLKVSGDQRILDDPRLVPVLATASDYVTAHHYRDRMSGIPTHDEQGTRDRPYDLSCDFSRDKVDAALASLGRKPWLAPRQRLSLFVSMRNEPAAFVLSADGRDSAIMREAFADAAEALAIPIGFPNRQDLKRIGLGPETLPRTGMPMLDAFASNTGSSHALAGMIIWSEAQNCWIAEWRFFDGMHTAIWRFRATSFDKAFQSAMRGVAQILSGNGDPG